ncbi:RING finger ubiquitin ligase-like protein [Calycina marina]|uniref:DSC E3 ubiquitin ligase complex subunit A n=1 Tax=Calycina marina TaxID=1763456 RepID=A0A9P7Z7J7_9HELO|nr:RING finger ubiquitin ligase-like protein [Calycina marina]
MPPQGPPPQEYSRVILIIVLFFFFWTSPEQGQPGFSAHDYAAERSVQTRHKLDVLNATRWQDFSPKGPNKTGYEVSRYLNLTGFREDDGFIWDRLYAFKKRAAMFRDAIRGESGRAPLEGKQGQHSYVYENITGVVRGRWVRQTNDLVGSETHRPLNLSAISPGIDWAYQSEDNWTRNVTGQEGKLMLRIEEKDVLGDKASKTPKSETEEAPGKEIREVKATMTIQDESSSGDGYEMRLHGVHWPKTGSLLMTTTSEKFAGIFGLPHLAHSVREFETSKMLLNGTLEKVVEKMENSQWFNQANPWSSTPDAQGDGIFPQPHCEYVVYVQVDLPGLDLLALPGDHAKMLEQIERELRYPNGAPLPAVPNLGMSAVIFSPDCGFMLESKGPPDYSRKLHNHLVGSKQEIWLHDIHNWLLMYGAVLFGQIILLKFQSKDASTPSIVGRVSLYTIAMMLMVDGFIFSALSLLSATAPNIFPSALIASFAALMSVALGVRFTGAVYRVQEPERIERLRAELAAEVARRPFLPALPIITPPSAGNSLTHTAVSGPILTAAGADIASPAPPQPAATPPIIIPSDQDIDAEIAGNVNAASTVQIPTQIAPLLPTTNRPQLTPQIRPISNFGAIYVKFVLTLTLFLFLSLSAISWPVPLRTAYIHFISLLYLSFWLPQIRRNVIRNCRKALLWKFIIGQSVLRLLPFAYFYLKADNMLFSEPDWRAFAFYVGWIWIQIWVLVAQEILGPRWGLPNKWMDEGWDYHPVLREDNVEAGGLPIGLVQNSSSSTLKRSEKNNSPGTRSIDCAICMQILEVPVIASGAEAGSSGVVGMLARRQYMVTPCRHVFHSTCLEGWMRFRLQCPICRENLPPL